MASHFRRSGRPDPESEHGGDDDWLTTYSDAMTILMAFFVLFYAMSEVELGRFNVVRAGIIEAFAGLEPAEVTDFADAREVKPRSKKGDPHFDAVVARIAQRLQELVANGTLQIFNSAKGIKLEFNSSALYHPGSARIRRKSKPMLGRIAAHIRELEGTPHVVVVEGHTDDTPIKTRRFPSNWELSTNRATNIVRYFVGREVSGENLKAAGYADMKPKVPNRDANNRPIPENRAQNRRIVISIEHY
jgi:chemotaxis protein MotB